MGDCKAQRLKEMLVLAKERECTQSMLLKISGWQVELLGCVGEERGDKGILVDICFDIGQEVIRLESEVHNIDMRLLDILGGKDESAG